MAEEHFSIESLAVYLHLTPPQVQRLADRGRLPGRKVGGQWRFAGAEIHHWMEEREKIKIQIQSGRCSEDEVLELAKKFDALKGAPPSIISS